MAPIPDFRLDGRVAIVTGASSGIGHRFAQVLAEQGASVLAAARRAGRLGELAATSDRIHAAACDVADDAQLEALVQRAVGDFGRIDVVVNNAGTTDAVTPAEHEDPAGNPKYDRSAVEEEPTDAVYGEADQVISTETEDERSSGPG